MKKLITLLLVLTGMVTTASAATYKVYIKTSNAASYNIYIFGDNVTAGKSAEWPGEKISTLSTLTVGETTYYVKEVTTSDNFSYIFNEGKDGPQTSNASIGKSVFLEYNGGTGCDNITSTALSDFLSLPGSHNSWTAENSLFTEDNGVYTYELSTTSYTTFKLYDGDWVSYSDTNIDAPAGWCGEDSGNIYLKTDNTGYSSYTLTAKKNGTKWDLKIRGKDAYAFTIAGDAAIVNNGSNWSTTDTDNDMVDEDNDGIFYLFVKNVNLEGGTKYYYKVYRDHPASTSAGGWQFPSNENNDYYVGTSGTYNLIYKLVCNNTWEGILTLEVIPATVSATIGESGYATFSSSYALDFTDITKVKAYRAESAAAGKVNMTQVTGKVPAQTGLFLAGETEDIPTTLCLTSVGDNLLKPTTGGDIYNTEKVQYVFAKQDSDYGFYKVDGSLSPDAGKAYLETDAVISSARLALVFDEDATGIESVKNITTNNNVVYNIAGQRVAQPTKGLYIVNGKKVIMK